MILNYLKIAWRNLAKRKFYSAVTILGLSVGMAFTLLVTQYIWSEVRVNTALKHQDHQYMVRSEWKKKEMGLEQTSIAPLGEALKTSYPELVSNYYRFDAVTTVVSKGDNHFREDIQIGDSTILGMYGFPLLHGDAKTAFDQPNSVVISTETANKYFGKTDVVGQTLSIDSFSGEKRDFMITGVLDELPFNSILNMFHEHDPILMSESSMAFFDRGNFDGWDNLYVVNYIELKEGVKPADLDQPIKQLMNTHASEQVRDNLSVKLMSLQDLYLDADNGLIRKTVATLSIVAFFIMLMAIVNFVNISIGSSSSRLKEIGVRKVLGSVKGQVIRQFLTESVLIAFFALLVSFVIYESSRSFFSEVLGKPIVSLFTGSPYFIGVAMVLTLITGVLAGIYPAFILSSLPSIESMKGKFRSVKENVLFRRILVVSQFTIALFVFGSAAFISRQVSFFFNKDLGYSKESVLSVPVPRDWTPEGTRKMETIRQELASLPEVSEASFSYEIPNGRSGFSAGFYLPGQDSTQAVFAPVLQTDEKFAPTYQIKTVAGKFFGYANDSLIRDKVVFNEAAVKALGFKNAEAAIGQTIRMQTAGSPMTIDGVVKDFHFESMHQNIRPVAFLHVMGTNYYRYMSIRLSSGDLPAALASVGKKWNQLMPGAPFEYKFIDDSLQQLYESELRLRKASQVATVLSIVIVLLGVLGTVSLNIARRTKELGIRKVLGASGGSIIMLFLKEFMIVLGIAIVVSFPMVYTLIGKWLKNYAYRVDIDWVTLSVVGVAFGGIVALLVGFQTLKAALENPVKSLKSD